MVWGCFVNNRPGPLVLVEGRLDANGYIEIVEKNLLPFMSNLEKYVYFLRRQCSDSYSKKSCKMEGRKYDSVTSLARTEPRFKPN